MTAKILAALAPLAAMPAFAQESQPDGRPTLWIIGDSTVKLDGDASKGRGEVVDRFFDAEHIRIENRAIGGRSSRTFLTEGRWDDILREAKAGEAERPQGVKETMSIAGERDYTHTNEAGALFSAERLVEGLRELQGKAGELATSFAKQR